MTLADMLFDSTAFALSLMAFGWALDLLRTRHRLHAAARRAADPFVGPHTWNRGTSYSLHLTAIPKARDRAGWPR